ncbi:hypothetical protein LPJGGPFB_03167 [Ensifer adhaerens]|uniref:hypothetical protein n=1 Tax=Ensifer adhaerens TaxID=106592 RepID=UPI001569DEB2|nr:hypothetical protein [Ensifer adhaerens]NRP19909.1 hypothetical protein [Ensifer adhaerens]
MTDKPKLPSDLAKQLSSMQDQVRKATEGVDFAGMSRRLADATSGLNNLGDLSQRFNEQNRRLAEMRDVMPALQAPRLSNMPRNPAFETNERLGRIEEQFEEMQTVLIEAAQIATTIQAHAADFLVSFEKASIQTDRSASRAILIGVIAIAIAIATPFLQAGVDRFVFPDNSAAELKAAVSDVGTAQATSTRTLAERVDSSSAAEAAILRDISRLLEKQALTESSQAEALQGIAKTLRNAPGK